MWTPTVRYQLSVSLGKNSLLYKGKQSRGVYPSGERRAVCQTDNYGGFSSLFQPFNHAHKVAKYCYADKVSAPHCPRWHCFRGEAAAFHLGLASCISWRGCEVCGVMRFEHADAWRTCKSLLKL